MAREGRKRVKVNLYIKQDSFTNIGVENYINYLQSPDGTSFNVLKGIFVLLNSSYYERYLTIINGTAQLNVSELNDVPLPELNCLEELGSKFNYEEKYDFRLF